MFYGTKVQNIMKSKQIMLIFFFFALVNIFPICTQEKVEVSTATAHRHGLRGTN